MQDIDLLKHPTLEKISPEKRLILTDLIQSAKGLSPEKAMPIMMQTQAKLKALGLSITPEESELMLSVMTQNMSETDRTKFDMLKKVARGKMKK